MATHQAKTVLLTGATGFVGRAACPAFADAGITVVTATRKPAVIAGARTVHAVGNIGPGTDWAPALAGVDTVVHLAARVHVTSDNAANPQAEYRRVNVDGTLALARAAVKAGGRRFVFVSSVKANGDATPPDRPFRDKDPPHPSDDYGKSKLEGETALQAYAKETGLQLVILRPPLVYGPGVSANFRALLWLCNSPWPLPFASVANRRSMIFVGNLVDALRRSVVAENPLPGPWLLSDGDDFSLAELTRHLRRDLGRAERLLSVPPGLMLGAAAALGQRGRADRLLGSLTVDGSGFRKAFGWTPPFTASEGFSATAAWYRSGLR
jgi:nucleoside-diphosphate-sugar epimerase